MGKDFAKAMEDKSLIVAKQEGARKNSMNDIEEAISIEETTALIKEINLCVVTYWIHTLAFLRDFGITSGLLIAMAEDKKQISLKESLEVRLTQDYLLQQLSNFGICNSHFNAFEAVYYVHLLEGFEANEFQELQSFVASRGKEEPDILILKEFVGDDVKRKICESLTEHYLELMDQAKSYLSEQSFYPEKSNYLNASKETVVSLFEICAFSSENQDQSAQEFLRQRFDWEHSVNFPLEWK
jgi:hypothetical protein